MRLSKVLDTAHGMENGEECLVFSRYKEPHIRLVNYNVDEFKCDGNYFRFKVKKY